MKYFIPLFLGAFLCISNADARKISYIEEVGVLGTFSGNGLACNASKYHTYEMLARTILITKAKSDKEELAGIKAYNEQKVNAFLSKIQDNFYECPSIAREFDRQKIFKMVIYGDGTIKMPDGSVISPRVSYDPTRVYVKDENERQKYLEMHKKIMREKYNDPVLKKAIRERQLKNGF